MALQWFWFEYTMGAYACWAIIRFLGCVLLGVPIERMEELFLGHWWIGLNAKIELGEKRMPY